MEALVALGLASNVVQFVDFVSNVFVTGAQIASSARGATEHNTELEKVYGHLLSFSTRLQPRESCLNGDDDARGLRLFLASTSDIDNHNELRSHIAALEDLAGDCNSLCKELLQTLQRLRTTGVSGGPFRYSITVFKTVWKERKIEKLEERLKRFQKLISLHFLPLLSEQQQYIGQALDALRDESTKLRLDQTAKFDDLSKRLQDLSISLPSASEQEILAQLEDSVSDRGSAAYLIQQAALERGHTFWFSGDDIRCIESGIDTMSITTRDLALIFRQQAFLRNLDFPSRRFRHDDITVAEEKTFQWILQPVDGLGLESRQENSLLSNWLAKGAGIFWISGKAGSGKSTLMKFICNHKRTRKLLEQWTSTDKLVVATHYFWTGGTVMQKSQRGLLHTLLYDIFRNCPEQIAKICPGRWANTKSTKPSDTKEWSYQELLETLRAFAKCTDISNKYCLFIDGVDEFDGDHFEMCQILKELSSSPNIKICLSSRPWNVFEDVFGIEWSTKLNIHNLTQHDILAYAESRLTEHPRWNETYFSRDQMDSVINDITEKAHGVFLWVFLVTKSLRDGIANGDTIRDLRRRLENMPSDLEPFFKHMLEIVDPLYHQQTARILRIAINARQPLDLQFYVIHEYEEDDSDYALNLATNCHSPDQLENTLEPCRRRINARCGGLLEIKARRVEFLHRTVRDFFLTREMDDYLLQKGVSDFNVNLSTLKGYVFLFKCWVRHTDWMRLADDQPFWRECLEYANDAIEECAESALAHLDAVEDMYDNISGSNDCEFLNVTADFVFRAELLNAGVDRYVSSKLREDRSFFDSVFESPLDTVVDQSRWSKGHIRIISEFLEFGADPNNDGSESAWHHFIQRACCLDADDHNFVTATENRLFSIFLKCGSSRTILVSPFSDSATLSISVKDSNLPCAHFLKAIFHHQNTHRFSNRILGTLEDFLASNTEEASVQLDALIYTTYEELQKLIGQQVELARLQFIWKVIQKIIIKGSQSTKDMEFIVPSVISVLGNAGSALADMIRGKDSSIKPYLVHTPRKRRLVSSKEVGRPLYKKAKLRCDPDA